MKLKEYIQHLQQIKNTHPDVDVVCASDQEGNSFEVVHYHPALGRFDGNDWETEGDLDEVGGKVNAVLLN